MSEEPAVIAIDDADDPRIAEFRHMRDPTLRSERDSFIAEGSYILGQAIELGLEVLSALVDARQILSGIASLPSTAKVFAAAPSVIGQITGLGVHRGVLALVRRPPQRQASDVATSASRLLILEGVENPVNVGLITRSAAAFGFDGLLVDPTSADPLYRRALTASRGAALRIPWARIGTLPQSLTDMGDAVTNDLTTVALTIADDAKPIEQLRLHERPRVALILGTEGFGLTEATAKAATVRARIDMSDRVDSLNVAAAAAIGCWEARRVSPR
jgi:tRNA G18 (ribose-2'-O)-methylase SpoU